MNIFVLSEDPVEAARMQCNKHCVKMVVETAQLLSNAHPVELAPYKRTHVNHPCSVWVRDSIENYRWLVEHGLILAAEYTKRYERIHKTEAVLRWLSSNEPALPKIARTPFAVAIKDPKYHRRSAVESYRAYYVGEKVKFARWEPRAAAPEWWNEMIK